MTHIDWTDATLARLGLIRGPGGKPVIPIPKEANIALDTVGAHAAGALADMPALIVDHDDGNPSRCWSYAELDAAARRLAAGLAGLGVGPGTPVAVHAGQTAATALTHLAVYRLGGIVVTLSQLYGPETVRHALTDSGARVVVTERAVWAALEAMAAELPNPPTPIFADHGPGTAGPTLAALMTGAPVPAETGAGTSSGKPALLMYTSGSTGLPKGLLHAHRILHAYRPTVRMFYDTEIDTPGGVCWTPADWAWVGGLLDLVLPAWQAGRTVIASQHRFDAKWAFAFMARHRVSHSFMTPTALKRLAQVDEPRARHDLALRVVCTGGESLPGEVVRWCEKLGVTCNEFYGLTEFNHLVGNCRALYEVRPGSMGRAYPGHATTIVDEQGHVLPPGEVGEIVAPADDPTLFLGYWGGDGIPDALRLGPWLRTRDLARRDEDGYFWYQGRNDDLIKSAGYRIGPAEVEDALLRHPAVAEAAVVGSPDPERGSVVKAFVRLARGYRRNAELAAELQDFVKNTLAVYKYPRLVEFVESFPLTSSGKIRRAELRRLEEERAASGRAPG